MCYSAEVWADYKKCLRQFPGLVLSVRDFVELYVRRRSDPKLKLPKGMDLAFLDPTTPEEQQIRTLIAEYNAALITKSEQDLFKQAKRLADAERKLAVKETKAALNDERVAGNKITQLKRWIADAKRAEPEPERDDCIFSDWYAPILIVENGQKIIRPMRYHCRPEGMDPSIDRTRTGQVLGTYNARRDNLTRFWRGQFGYTHGLMLAERFYENGDAWNGGSMELQFAPKPGEAMFIACLWSKWTDPKGELPDLYSFAAVTSDPMPEVAAAGHDTTIINLKPENVDAWLNPDPANRGSLLAILDDPQRPYYEQRKAA